MRVKRPLVVALVLLVLSGGLAASAQSATTKNAATSRNSADNIAVPEPFYSLLGTLLGKNPTVKDLQVAVVEPDVQIEGVETTDARLPCSVSGDTVVPQSGIEADFVAEWTDESGNDHRFVLQVVEAGLCTRNGSSETFTGGGVGECDGVTADASRLEFSNNGSKMGTITIVSDQADCNLDLEDNDFVGCMELVVTSADHPCGGPRGGGGGTTVEGRMTGGGFATDTTGGRATFGLSLHCVTDSVNTLEVNWGSGNRFHLTNLAFANCNDPFDTHKGAGTGDYNGSPGATAEWTLVDNGEPGSNDTIDLTIKSGTTTVLKVTGKLGGGNFKAHTGPGGGSKKGRK